MIVVSGASGFLGSYVVCILLEKGKRVRAFRRATSTMHEFNNIFNYYFIAKTDFEKEALLRYLEWITADVTDISSLDEGLTGANEVYHCAAMVSFVQKDRKKMLHINAEGTTNMVNMALQKGVQSFCHVSSIAALGRAKSGELITEEAKWNQSKHNSNYAISKYKAEMEVWRAAEEGLNVTIVNPGVILGVGDWNKGSSKLFKLVWNGMPFYTEGVNGYVEVKDVARAMIYIMEKKLFGERFILVGKNVNMRWYLDMVAAFLGKKKPTIKVNHAISQLAWMVDGFKSFLLGKTPSLTKETARAARNQYFYSSAKIEKLGFAFTPMEQTLEETCKQFLITNSN